jgi:YjbE family integral membrane protein
MSIPLWADIAALAQIAFIDLVLAGDNAIVVGLAVAGLQPDQRRRAILFGLGGAVFLRILFSLVALRLLAILGLTLAGGLLLLWVAWKLFRDLRAGAGHKSQSSNTGGRKTMRAAVISILVADVSMSLDNALAVAGAAHGNIPVLIIGLTLSVALMAVAAEWVARLIERHRWLAYVGLAIVAYVSIDMIVRGSQEVVKAI